MTVDLTKRGTISTHADADGVASACLFNTLFDPPLPVEVQRIFGTWSTSTTYVLDMVPEGDYKEVVIDHHQHPENPSYALKRQDVPTSLIIWNLWKDRIPREKWWLSAVGLVGDGQAALIPHDVFKQEPLLLQRITSIYPEGKSGFNIKVYDNPVWFQLSSPINALCKTRHENMAYNILNQADGPLDIVKNPVASEAKQSLNFEKNKWMREGSYFLIGEVIIGLVDSDYIIERDIARQIEQEKHSTTLIINERSKNGSVRGVLSTWLEQLFADKTLLDIGGHPGFMGATLTGNLDEIIQRIRRARL